jgi:hypothetical protein
LFHPQVHLRGWSARGDQGTANDHSGFEACRLGGVVLTEDLAAAEVVDSLSDLRRVPDGLPKAPSSLSSGAASRKPGAVQ